jgi:hypothetical protein
MSDPVAWLREAWQTQRTEVAGGAAGDLVWPQEKAARLADLDGKLAILDLYEQADGNPRIHEDARTVLRRVIRYLAQPLVSRTDFPPELRL